MRLSHGVEIISLDFYLLQLHVPYHTAVRIFQCKYYAIVARSLIYTVSVCYTYVCRGIFVCTDIVITCEIFILYVSYWLSYVTHVNCHTLTYIFKLISTMPC